MRMTVIMTLPALLLACASVSEEQDIVLPETTLPVFGDGYPEPGAPCRRVGESAETIEFLDHTRDLVGCPEAWEGHEDYARSVNAEEVLRQDGWVLYSIPLGI